MTDTNKLKELAEACGNLNWRFQQEGWTEYAIRDDHAYIATMRVGSPKQKGPCPEREAKAKFLGAMTPATVLELIAEVERLRKDAERYQALRQKDRGSVVVRDRTSLLFGENLDAAIDAALEGGGR